MNDKKLTPNEKLVKTYIAIRDERNKLAREYDTKDRDLANDLISIEQALLSSCNEIGADSMRTEFGTVIKSTRENFVCGDWDNFKKFVLENEAVELLQQRIHQSNFKEFLSGREDEGLPPGISTMREFKITVRKPSKS
tara:strand:+ start:220 stop:633 length:414 start_codon:yes stop_codon:yes gene_type:complete